MLPGEGVEHPNFGNIVHDLVLLHSLGARLVLVHGSRPQIEARLAARGLAPRYHRDLRVTDAPTLECVIDAVGSLRIAIEARLSMDMAASPMQGARLRVAGGNLVTARPIGVVEGVDYHHTGEVRRIDRKGIGRLLDERSIVLLSPLGYSPTGEIFNLACEDVAMRAAIDLEAEKLILYGAEQGLLDASGKLVRELRPQQVPAHLQRLGNSYKAELLDAAAQACRPDRRFRGGRAGLSGGQPGVPPRRAWRRTAGADRGARARTRPEDPVRAHHADRALVPRARLPAQQRRAATGGAGLAVQLPAQFAGIREEPVIRRRVPGRRGAPASLSC